MTWTEMIDDLRFRAKKWHEDQIEALIAGKVQDATMYGRFAGILEDRANDYERLQRVGPDTPQLRLA